MVAKLYPSLNPVASEMFFCRKLILVEGYEDVAYINAYLHLSKKIEDFRKHGCHIVPMDGKSKLIKPLAVAKLLDIPCFVVFDLDTDKSSLPLPKREQQVPLHKKDNRSILDIQDMKGHDEWPSSHIKEAKVFAWKNNLTVDVKADLGDRFTEFRDKSLDHYGNASGLVKNPLAIARALELAWSAELKSQLLIDCVESIIAFAKTEQNSSISRKIIARPTASVPKREEKPHRGA